MLLFRKLCPKPIPYYFINNSESSSVVYDVEYLQFLPENFKRLAHCILHKVLMTHFFLNFNFGFYTDL